MWWYTASDYGSIEGFQQEFVSSFTLGDISNCVYMIKVEAIYGPLFVFCNYGSVGDDKNKSFCALPKLKWGKFTLMTRFSKALNPKCLMLSNYLFT
jgi:hypothetical protein